MTNGEKFLEIFGGKQQEGSNPEAVFVENIPFMFDDEWWYAPYQKISKSNQIDISKFDTVLKPLPICLKTLSTNNFPVTKSLIIFKLKSGEIHVGRYDYNDYYGRRWFDENKNEYTSDKIDSFAVLC